MKKLIFILIVVIVQISNIKAQTGWVIQNSGSTSNLNSVFFVDSATGYAVGNSALLKTTNGGSNWSSQSSQTLYSVFFLDVNTGYTGGVNYIYKTTNGGTIWTTSYYNTLLLKANSIYFINSLTGIVAGSWYIVKQSGGVILRTTDGGSTWITVLSINPAEFLSVNFSDSFTGYTGGNSPLYKSINSGQSWNSIPGPAANSIHFINAMTGWAVVNSVGNNLSKTTNGGNNWSSYTLANPLYSVHFADDQTGWVCGSGGSIYGSTNGGANWTLQSSGTTTFLYSMSFVNSQTGWAVGSSGRILKTTNGGITSVQPISNEIPNKFNLYQNYPNPFNPTTKIKFSLPFPSKGGVQEVRLIIYDILGRQVASLIPPLWGGQEGLKPGSYEVEFDGTNYPSGVYFYKLTAGNFISARRLVLIK